MWLLEEQALKRIEFLETQTFDPVAMEVSAKAARGRMTRGNGPVAEIDVKGVLTQDYNFLTFLAGGTAYTDIIAAVEAAEKNSSVEAIKLNIDSPGGNIRGMFDTMDVIAATTKPITTDAKNATSAAYGLASVTDSIRATHRSSMLGSIGIVASLRTDDSVVEVASTEAPKKRPDPTTDDGKAVVRETLDGVHELFVEAIAKGRGTTSAKVNKTYGQGGVLLAQEALDRGMIDAIGASQTISTQAVDETGAKMDLVKLKAEFPAVYAEAVAIGVDKERDRACAHLTMGESTKAMDVAAAAIKAGEDMTMTRQAEYMTRGLAARDQDNRQEDDPEVEASLTEDGPDMGDMIVAELGL